MRKLWSLPVSGNPWGDLLPKDFGSSGILSSLGSEEGVNHTLLEDLSVWRRSSVSASRAFGVAWYSQVTTLLVVDVCSTLHLALVRVDLRWRCEICQSTASSAGGLCSCARSCSPSVSILLVTKRETLVNDTGGNLWVASPNWLSLTWDLHVLSFALLRYLIMFIWGLGAQGFALL